VLFRLGDFETLDFETLDFETLDAETLDAETLDAETLDAETLDDENLGPPLLPWVVRALGSTLRYSLSPFHYIPRSKGLHSARPKPLKGPIYNPREYLRVLPQKSGSKKQEFAPLFYHHILDLEE
jgi:hypothetical protein